MRKLIILLLFFISYSSFAQNQEVVIYDFENLNLDNVTNQDGWEYSTSLCTSNNGYNCPVVGNEVVPQISYMPTSGDYIGSQTISSGNGFGIQHLVLSRLNNSSWSFPSFEDKRYLIITFDMANGCWGKIFRLAFDQSSDGNFGQNCGQVDHNEASFGIGWFGCGLNYLNLFGASSQILVTENNITTGWVRYRMVIDFLANNSEGKISVFTKNLTDQADWESVPTMQNINLGFDISSTGNDNPYNLNGIMLEHEAGGNSNFDNFEFTTLNLNSKDTIICDGENITLGSTVPLSGVTYEWNTGENTATINVDSTGLYYVDIKIDDFTIIKDSINVQLITTANPTDTTMCSDQPITIFIDPNLDSYLWDDNSTESSRTINQAGMYHVTVTNRGCIEVDTFNVIEINPPFVNLGNDTIICPDIQFRLNPYTNGTTFKWNDGTTQSSKIIKQTGQYILTAAIEQCYESDTINIVAIPSLKLGNDTTICENDFFTIQLDTTYDDYSWNDGDKRNYKEIHYDGEYYLTTKKYNCIIKSDTLIVKRNLLPRILEFMKDTTICENSPLLLKTKADLYDKIVWHDFQSDTFNIVKHAGDYWVKAINNCGEDIDSVIVKTEDCLCEIYMPNVFTPNGDNLNDDLGFESNCIPSKFYNLFIFNRWGELIFESDDYNEKWDGKYKGRLCQKGIYNSLLTVQFKYDNSKRVLKRKFSINY